MTEFKNGELVEWNPDLSSEALAHVARVRAEIEPKVSLVRRIRAMLGLSQIELAEILQVTQSNVSKIEGKGDPALSVLARMVEAKGATLRLEVETADGVSFRFPIAA